MQKWAPQLPPVSGKLGTLEPSLLPLWELDPPGQHAPEPLPSSYHLAHQWIGSPQEPLFTHSSSEFSGGWAGGEKNKENVLEHPLCIRYCSHIISSSTSQIPQGRHPYPHSPSRETKHSHRVTRWLWQNLDTEWLFCLEGQWWLHPPWAPYRYTPILLPCHGVSLGARPSWKGSVGASPYKPSRFTETRVGGGCVTSLLI